MMDEPTLFRRYLLGELDESAQEDFERKLMTSEEHFQELLIAEDELVDDYCAGELSESDARKYRERFLVTAERRHRHRFGAALRKHVSAGEPRRARDEPAGRVWKLSLAAAAAALVVAAGLWSIRPSPPPPFRLAEAQALEGSSAAFYLTTGGLRTMPSEPEQVIEVPGGVALVELQLDLPADARGDYDVTLENARTNAILAEGTLTARTIDGEWVVVATLPSELLPPSDYRVLLRGPSRSGEPAAVREYDFRVRRR
jgi:hypothetical protein